MSRIRNKLNWQAISSKERYAALEELKTTISQSGGYITNFKMFSDLALSLTIEIEEGRIPRLYTNLCKTLRIEEQLDEDININSVKEWWILMHVSFSKGTGNLRIAVPAVPG